MSTVIAAWVVGILMVPTLVFAIIRMRAESILVFGLGFYVLVPTKVLQVFGLDSVLPTFAFLLLWGVKRFHEKTDDIEPRERALGRLTTWFARGAAAMAVTWMLILTIVRDAGFGSVAWTLSFGSALVIPLFVKPKAGDWRAVKSAWIVLGSIISVYMLVEYLIGNPIIYSTIYNELGVPSIQHWAVYRSEGSFGHPLFAGTFLSVAAVLAASEWVEKRRFAVLAFMLCVAGTATTVSRGAFLAIAIGLLALIMLHAFHRQSRNQFRLLLVVLLSSAAALAVWSVSGLGDRLTGEDADGSNLVRDLVYQAALEAARVSDWLGYGPGRSAEAIAAWNPFGYPLESGPLQLLVSIGIPGVALCLISVLLVGVRAWRRGNLSAVALLITYVAAISTYNAIDQLRPQHFLFACLLIGANSASSSLWPAIRLRRIPKASSTSLSNSRLTGYADA